MIIEDPRNQVVVSAASLWEMSIKQAKGLLSVDDDLESIVVDEGVTALPIALFHAQQAGRLPFLHKDPFDRMLIAQAQAEGCELVTADSVIPRYGIRVFNARI
ncbi:type II toxin-antitoxin system VapC family toxin [Pseudomonas putida]